MKFKDALEILALITACIAITLFAAQVVQVAVIILKLSAAT